MPLVSRITDTTSGHDSCGSVPIVTGSDLMIVEGQPVARITDKVQPHGCPSHSTHQGEIVTGSALLIVDGQKVARIGDKIGGPCPTSHVIVTGSSLMDVGD